MMHMSKTKPNFFSKMHMGHDNPNPKYKLSRDWIESSQHKASKPWREGLGVLTELSMTQQHALAVQKANCIPGPAEVNTSQEVPKVRLDGALRYLV